MLKKKELFPLNFLRKAVGVSFMGRVRNRDVKERAKRVDKTILK